MNNFKKAMLTSLTLAGMAIGVNAQAAVDPTAVVVWTGKVPALNAGENLLITGLGGNQSALTGVLSPNADGSFVSTSILLEAHANTGTVTAPVAGDLANAKWTVKAADVSYGGSAQVGQKVTVQIDGTDVDLGDSVDAETIGLTVSQTEGLAADVTGKDVQASVTLMASVI